MAANNPKYDRTNQPLSGVDYRRPPSVVLPSYNRANTPPYDPCPGSCADMLSGTAGDAPNSLANWIFWQWSGLISPQAWWPQDPITPTLGTAYPSDRQHPNGAGGQARQGDWAAVWYPNPRTDVQDVAHDLLYASSAYDTPISPPPPDGLNWGKAVDLNLYLWGPSPGPDTVQHAQMWMNGVVGPIPPGGCGGPFPSPPCPPPYTGWEDLQISGLSATPSIQFSCVGGCPSAEIDRVRFTRAVRFRIYSNLEGRGESYPLTQPFAPTRCTIGFQPNGFDGTVWGLFMQQPVEGPQPGEFGGPGVTAWTMAGGVYLRVIDP